MELCIPHRQRLQLDVVDKPMRVSSTGEKGAFRHPRNRYHTYGWELTQSHKIYMDKPWPMAETATRMSWKFENGQLIIQVHRSL